MWGIARRQAALWARRNRRPELLPPQPPHLRPRSQARADLPARPDQHEEALTRLEIEAAVAGLSAPDRELWRLMYEEDRSVAEVAKTMGIAEGTVDGMSLSNAMYSTNSQTVKFG